MDQSVPQSCRKGDDHCACGTDYCGNYQRSTPGAHSRTPNPPFFGLQDSTIEFEKRRNIPVRYDRELVQTTIKAMKRVAEIKAKRERAFFKHRMAVAKERHREARKNRKELRGRVVAARDAAIAKTYAEAEQELREEQEEQRGVDLEELVQPIAGLNLVQPISASAEKEKVRIKEKIKVKKTRQSALVPGDGRSMGMELD